MTWRIPSAAQVKKCADMGIDIAVASVWSGLGSEMLLEQGTGVFED